MSTIESHPAGDSGLRERKKQQTRQALHDAALTLVSAHGLDGVTIEQICADADVSPRTFFNYFSSKAHAALGLDSVRSRSPPQHGSPRLVAAWSTTSAPSSRRPYRCPRTADG